MVGGELATCPYDTDKTEDECEDPTRGAAEAMTVADVDCNEDRGEVKKQFEDGDTTTGIEVHGSGVQRDSVSQAQRNKNDEDDSSGMEDLYYTELRDSLSHTESIGIPTGNS